jgi:hypothetical protein
VIVVVACITFWVGLIAGMLLGAAVIVDNESRRLRTLDARDRRLAEWADADTRGRRIARDGLEVEDA